jgi:hypothetical protein
MPQPPLTIGVLGTGETSRKNVASGISDLIAGGRAKFILPVTDEHCSVAVRAVHKFARTNDYPYDVIIDDSTEEMSDVDELLDEATKTYRVKKVPRALVSLVEKAGEKGRLVLAWDDEDPAASSAMELAIDKGITPLDLTQGMEKLTFDEEDDDGPEDGDREEQPETDETGTDKDQDEPRVVDSGPVVVSATAEQAEESREFTSSAEQADAEPVANADEAQVDPALEGLHDVAVSAVRLMYALLNEIRRVVHEEVTEATKPRPRGRPRKDTTKTGA